MIGAAGRSREWARAWLPARLPSGHVVAVAALTVVALLMGCMVATTAVAGVAPAAALVSTVAVLALAPAVLMADRPWLYWGVLGGLTLGTLIGDKGFAYQNFQLGSSPIYVTDVALAVLLVLVLVHPRLFPTVRPALAAIAPFVPFLLWGTFLLVQGLPAYGVDALKDFAIFYYLLFLPIGYVAIRAPRRPAFLLFAALVAGCAWIVVESLVVTVKGGGESLSYGVGYLGTRPIFGWSGLYVAIAALLTLALLAGVDRWWRRAGIAFVVAGLTCVYLGQQRSVWVALFVGLLALVVLHPSWRRRVPRFGLVALPVVGVLTVVLLQLAELPGRPLPTGLDRLSAGLVTPQQDPTTAWRLAAWSTALDLVEADPLTGGGLGTPFTWSVQGFQVENRPHNTFLTVAVKSGVPGLLLLAVPLLWMYVAAIRTCLDPAVPLAVRHRLAGLLAGHLALTTYGGFNLLLESPYVAWPFWALAGVMLAVRHDGMAQASRADR